MQEQQILISIHLFSVVNKKKLPSYLNRPFAKIPEILCKHQGFICKNLADAAARPNDLIGKPTLSAAFEIRDLEDILQKFKPDSTSNIKCVKSG